MANTEFSVEDPIDFNPQVGQSVLAQQCVVSSLHFTIELAGSGDIRYTEPFSVAKFVLYIPYSHKTISNVRKNNCNENRQIYYLTPSSRVSYCLDSFCSASHKALHCVRKEFSCPCFQQRTLDVT
jgi:hypothetical protein